MKVTYFAELLVSIATLNITITGAPDDTQFQYKSEDGTFIMNIFVDDSEPITVTLPGKGIKIIPKLARVQKIKDDFFFSFKLDSKFISADVKGDEQNS